MTALAWFFLIAAAFGWLLLACALVGSSDQIGELRTERDWARDELKKRDDLAHVIPFQTAQKDRIAGRIAANQTRRVNWHTLTDGDAS